MLSAEFTDPRLVAVYDTLNAYAPGTQPEFYLQVARDLGARSVVEIGCGTGLISRLFLDRGYDLTGLDPAGPMLAVARTRPGADRARWIKGDLAALDVRDADLAFMAGHVAQFFVSDDGWCDALTHLRRSLRRGGLLAFESRNPAARGWETWGHRTTAVDPVAGPVERWGEVHDVSGDVVSGRMHVRFLRDGDELVADGPQLRFRSVDELRRTLDEADFAVTQTYGDWDRRPLDAVSPEIIIVAQAR